MLVIHPTSTCDVCLDGYTGDSDLIPHAIACGHVFCLTCLQSLRALWCPLCRTPFTSDDIRRLHMDRSIRQTPTPSPQASTAPLSIDGVEISPKLVDEFKIVDSSTSKALDLQNKITGLIRESSLEVGVPESGVRELIDEIHSFLAQEPGGMHLNLRAVFLLLYHFFRLQSQCSTLEKENQSLQSQSIEARQATLDAERKCAEVQKERLHERESARSSELILREQHKAEKMELQRKIDEITRECKKLEEDLNALRPPSVTSNPQTPPSRPSSSARQFYSDRFRRRDSSEDEDERMGFRYNDSNTLMLSLSAPKEEPRRDRFHLSPVPSMASALPVAVTSENNLSNFVGPRPYKFYEKSRPNSDSMDVEGSNAENSRTIYSGISYASASAQTSARSAITGNPIPSPSSSSSQRRERSPDSSPKSVPRFDYFSRQPEASTAAPGHNADVARLYSLLDSPLPLPVPPPAGSNPASNRRPSRSRTQSRDPSPARSANYHSQPSRSFNPPPPVPPLPNTRPAPTSTTTSAAHSSSVASATHNRTQAPAISQSYTVGHIHSHPQAYVPTYSLNASPGGTKKPPMPAQDQRLGQVRGTLERRGSFSSASAAAGVPQSSGSMSHRDGSNQQSAQSHHRNGSHHRPTNMVAAPAIVAPSTLGATPSKNIPVSGSGHWASYSTDAD